MDFVSATLFDGRRQRALTVVDASVREALATDVGRGINGKQVVAVMKSLASIRNTLRTIRTDKGS